MNYRESAPNLRASPLLRFVAIGFILWLGSLYNEWRGTFVVDPPSEQSLEVSYRDWAQRAGFYPNDRQREEILRTEVEDRVLFTEAVRQKLFRDDSMVYQRLLTNARFVGIEGDDAEVVRTALALNLHLSDELIRRHLIEKLKARVRAMAHPIVPPSNALLHSRYRSDRDRWKRAPSIALEQIFFSADAPDLNARLTSARIALDASHVSEERAYMLGDRFLLGNKFPWIELPKVRDMFGQAFADALQAAIDSGDAPPGNRDWIGPVESSYGVHFVKITSYRAPSQRPFDDVMSTLIFEEEQKAESNALVQYMSELLVKYRIGTS